MRSLRTHGSEIGARQDFDPKSWHSVRPRLSWKRRQRGARWRQCLREMPMRWWDEMYRSWYGWWEWHGAIQISHFQLDAQRCASTHTQTNTSGASNEWVAACSCKKHQKTKVGSPSKHGPWMSMADRISNQQNQVTIIVWNRLKLLHNKSRRLKNARRSSRSKDTEHVGRCGRWVPGLFYVPPRVPTRTSWIIELYRNSMDNMPHFKQFCHYIPWNHDIDFTH